MDFQDQRLAGTGKNRQRLGARIYQCPIDQKTGDLESCSDAGKVDGAVRNFGIAVR